MQEKQPYFNLLIYYSGEVLVWLKNNQPVKAISHKLLSKMFFAKAEKNNEALQGSKLKQYQE